MLDVGFLVAAMWTRAERVSRWVRVLSQSRIQWIGGVRWWEGKDVEVEIEEEDFLAMALRDRWARARAARRMGAVVRLWSVVELEGFVRRWWGWSACLGVVGCDWLVGSGLHISWGKQRTMEWVRGYRRSFLAFPNFG